jgi:hypothetical protein
MKKLKGMHKSLTIWFNTICIAALPVFEYAHDNLDEIKQYLPDRADSTYKYVGLFVVVINMALRFRTTKPLAEK